MFHNAAIQGRMPPPPPPPVFLGGAGGGGGGAHVTAYMRSLGRGRADSKRDNHSGIMHIAECGCGRPQPKIVFHHPL